MVTSEINVNVNLHLSWCFELKLEWLITTSISFSKLKQYKNATFVYSITGKLECLLVRSCYSWPTCLSRQKKVQNAVPCWNQMTVLPSEVTKLIPGNIWQHDFTVNVDSCLLRNNISKQKKFASRQYHMDSLLFCQLKMLLNEFEFEYFWSSTEKGPSTIITDWLQ